MTIDLVHVKIGATDVAIFHADAENRSRRGRQEVLADLTARALGANLRVDRAVLAFIENGKLTYFGDPETVRTLSRNGLVYQPNRRLTV